MLINEVCKECNLTKKAVEYYTEQGLIQPRITENGYRQFSETDALKLKRIAVLRGLGFSVPEIRTILENDSRTAIYDVLNRKEFEIVELQTKQALIKQLAESGDWEHIEGQVEALQNKQSILNRILDKFPGFYGKFVCLHFAPFLSEAITTNEQREAFETIIRYLDGISIAVPSDVQQYLDEIRENADVAVTQSASAVLAAAMADPEKYIHDNKEMLEQYRAVAKSEEYKASPAYRLQEYLKQFQSESGYNDVFIPAMQGLAPLTGSITNPCKRRMKFSCGISSRSDFVKKFIEQFPPTKAQSTKIDCAFSLPAPYSEERRKAASEAAKKSGVHGKVAHLYGDSN